MAVKAAARHLLPLSLCAGCVAGESSEVRVAGSGSNPDSRDSHPSGSDSAHSGDSGADSSSDSGSDPEPLALRVAVVSDLNGSYGSTSYSADIDAAVAAILADPPTGRRSDR